VTRSSVKLTREELYRQVWEKPTTHLAKEFGISDVAVGKICKKLDVPKPPLGYWRQVEVGGVAQNPPPLPPPKRGVPAFVVITPNPARNSDISKDPEVEDIIIRESLPENRIRVSDQLRDPHPLIKEAKQVLQGVSVDDYGMLWQHAILDLRVSKKMLGRALRIMDALVKALEARGVTIEIPKRGWPKRACAVVGEAVIEMRLWERSKRSERELTAEERKKPPHMIYDRYVYTPSGELNFKISGAFFHGVKENWTEKASKPIEEQLNEIVAAILTAAHVALKKRQKDEEEKRLRQEALVRQQESEQKRQEEESRRKELELQSQNWVKSQNLRAFLRACEGAMAERSGGLAPDGAGAEWLRWAYSHADRLDPLRNGYLESVASEVTEAAESDAEG
jgi:hypothetical protein